MKRISYKTILLIYCLSIFSSTLSLSFVRAESLPGDSCYLTETIEVFNQQTANTGNHAIKTITIPDLPLKSCIMELEARSGDDDWWRAIHFDVDGVGGAILTWREGPGQVRGPGVLYYVDQKYFQIGMSDECYFATSVNYEKYYHNFIPQDPSQTVGYFSPGQHTITSFVTAPANTPYRSWVTVILHFTYKFIPAIIDFDPDTLNPKSQGKWVTVYIEFPEADCDVSVSDIDVETVRLNGLIPAELKPTEVGDHDGDGNSDLMVKFDRADVKDKLEPGEKVIINISGELTNGIVFEGEDEIQVLDFG